MLLYKKFYNIEAVIIKLLKELNISIKDRTIINELESHPDCPSLLSVSDILTHFGVNNNSLRISIDKINDVPCPFVAHMTDDRFLLINSINETVFNVSDEISDNCILSKEEFTKKFSGVVLIVQLTENHRKNKFLSGLEKKISLLNERLLAIIVTTLIIFFINADLSFITTVSWSLIMLIIIKIAGLTVSVLLLIQSIENNNPFIQKLCKAGKNFNCNAILNSKSAMVFNGLSWSEVGFFYFSSTLLLLLLNKSVGVIQLLSLLTVASLPYTVYSVYYQARVAKQWCVLCCAIQALLWIEFLTSISYGNLKFTFPGSLSLYQGITCLLLTILCWLLLKPLLLKSQQIKSIKEQLRKFKYNRGLFQALLSAQPKYILPDEEWSIVLGTSEAKHLLTVVSNPYCPSCAKMHLVLDEWLTQRKDLQMRIIFASDDNQSSNSVSQHMIALDNSGDKKTVKQALHHWFDQQSKDYSEWAKAYPVKINPADHDKMSKQKIWCNLVNIKVTPTVFIDGHLLPELYQLNDLKYMII